MSAREAIKRSAWALSVLALPIGACGCIAGAEPAGDAEVEAVDAASLPLCGRGSAEPPALAASVEGDATVNPETGELRVHTKKSGGDEEHERAKLTASIPSPDAAGDHYFTATFRMRDGFIHQTAAPLLGYSEAGVEIKLRVFMKDPRSGQETSLCEDSRVWKKGGEPSAHVNLEQEQVNLSCSFFSLRGAPNLRAEATLHGWTIAGGVAGGESMAVARLEEIEYDLCSD